MPTPPWNRLRSHRPTVQSASGEERPRLGGSELDELATMFRTPPWLRDLGFSAWCLVGAVLLLVGMIWLIGETQTIVDPIVAAGIVAMVSSPVVGKLHARGLHRGLGAVLVLLSALVLGVLILLLVVGGITSQGDSISSNATAAADTIQSWVDDLGVNDSGSSSVSSTLKGDTPQIVSTLAHGVLNAVEGVTSLIFAFTFAALGLFFLLKDGPSFRKTVEGHMGVPVPVARVVTADVISSLRRYFLGVTIVAVFNGVVVGLGALILGVPLAGTIAIVTVVTAYIPYIGAVVSGAFAVTLALGSQGTTAALIMLVIVILANGLLQNILQPIAFGATLGLNPLVVLIVTISAGCLFGMFGLVLAAPLTSAAVRITGDLTRARVAQSEQEHEPGPELASGEPAPA